AITGDCDEELQLENAAGGISAGALVATTITIEDTPAAGSDYWVGKDGSDANSCATAETEGTPKLTIAAGMGCLSAGETLTVKVGVYTDDFIESVPSGTSWANATTVIAKSGDTVQIKASCPQSSSKRPVLMVGKSYVIVDGFILGNDSSGEQCTYDNVKISGNSDHIRITGNEIRYSYSQGVLVTLSTDIEILDNNIHDNGHSGRGNQVHGTYFSQVTNGLIQGNTFTDNLNYGIQFWYTNATANNNNEIRDNVLTGSVNRAAINVKGSNNLIANNIMYDNENAAGAGPMYQLAGDSNHWIHNTAYSNDGSCGYNSGGTNTLFKNNICYANGTDGFTVASGDITDTTNTKVDPTFDDVGSFDFNISSGSAAEGAGTADAEVTDDFNDVARGSPPDNGAYEVT
ncbi:hypothetical protein LCGC14_2555570, partial [marine sediment metagenome]